jgi:hypothetical protein
MLWWYLSFIEIWIMNQQGFVRNRLLNLQCMCTVQQTIYFISFFNSLQLKERFVGTLFTKIFMRKHQNTFVRHVKYSKTQFCGLLRVSATVFIMLASNDRTIDEKLIVKELERSWPDRDTLPAWLKKKNNGNTSKCSRCPGREWLFAL